MCPITTEKETTKLSPREVNIQQFFNHGLNDQMNEIQPKIIVNPSIPIICWSEHLEMDPEAKETKMTDELRNNESEMRRKNTIFKPVINHQKLKIKISNQKKNIIDEETSKNDEGGYGGQLSK